MKRLAGYRGSNVLLIILMILVTGCSGHEAKVAFYTFFFFLIMIPFCLPAFILGLVSRGSSSRAAKVISIVFTSLGGFFTIIYTASLIDDFYGMDFDEELIIYLFILWGTLISSLILLVVPKEEKEMQTVENERAEIKNTGSQTESIRTQSKSVNESNSGIDMSGLDDLADL
ncbi:hypothetical protein N9M27_02515 [Flavobacteriales bacterium]|nr:hypothetical protein [Flavobacteriales bacterium]